jgi:hypothetical protein
MGCAMATTKANGATPMKGAQRQTQTRVDTILVSQQLIASWRIPPFQRPIRVNAKVLELVEAFKVDGGVFPGILTVGILGGETFIVDGQHRVEAFKLSEIAEGYSDVRYRYYESMAEMAEDFVRLNSQLVKMRPDDILRGLEATSGPLQIIRERCAFVGYDQIRRGRGSTAIVSASMLLRSWIGSIRATPQTMTCSVVDLLRGLTSEEAGYCVEFLQLAEKAWGRDPEYGRLWGLLNLTICAWLYRRTVMATYSAKTPKLSKDIFRKCLIGLSADANYTEWLVGRNMSDRDRSPCYGKIKSIFARSLERELGKKIYMPKPEWATAK